MLYIIQINNPRFLSYDALRKDKTKFFRLQYHDNNFYFDARYERSEILGFLKHAVISKHT